MRKASWMPIIMIAAVLCAGWMKSDGAYASKKAVSEEGAAMASEARDSGAAAATTAEAKNRGSDASDLARLVSYAEAAMPDGYTVTLAYRAALPGYSSDASLEEAGGRLSREFGLSPKQDGLETITGDAPAYKAEADWEPAGAVSFMLVGAADRSSSYLVLKLTAESGYEPDAVQSWLADTEEHLDRLSLEGQWNFMVQGMIPNVEKNSGSAQSSADDWGSFHMDRVASDFGAQPVESYRDSGTYSVSFSSNKLLESVRSGIHNVSLQAALHRLSTDGKVRMTLGVPLITGEY